jgi:hypothetical protein
MRKLLLLLLTAAAVIWMYQHPEELRSKSTATCAKISQFFGSLAGEFTAGNGLTPSNLPDGVYCLTQPVRFTYSGGATMQPVGALVRKTGDGGNGKVLVTDEVGNAVVDVSMLTRDPALVTRLAQMNAAPAPSQAMTASANAAATAKQVQEIDAKLASLRSELASIQQRDQLALAKGRQLHFATSDAFVRSAIRSLEVTRAKLIAQNSSPPAR